MAQQLILPINNHKLLIGTTSQGLEKYAKKVHGVDIKQFGSWTISDLTENHGVKIWGSGNGTVIAVGKDTNFGNVAVVKYPNVESRVLGGVLGDVIVRYYHLQSYAVKAGQTITKDTIIGYTGRTGKVYYPGARTGLCRIEVDRDTQYPCYSGALMPSWPQGEIIKRGNNDTVSYPKYVFHVKSSAPDYQKVNPSALSTYTDPSTNINYRWYDNDENNIAEYNK